MSSFRRSFSARMSTSTPSLATSPARAANSTGPRTLAGSLTRSRASSMPSASAARAAQAFRMAADSAMAIVTATGLAPASPLSSLGFLYLSKTYPRRRRPRAKSATCSGVTAPPSGFSSATERVSALPAAPMTAPPRRTQSLSLRSATLPVPTTTSRSRVESAGAMRSSVAIALPVNPAVFAARAMRPSRPRRFGVAPSTRSAPAKTTSVPLGFAAGLAKVMRARSVIRSILSSWSRAARTAAISGPVCDFVAAKSTAIVKMPQRQPRRRMSPRAPVARHRR
jgi:hypothetical protein